MGAFFGFVFGVIGAVVVFAILVAIFQWLWNITAPEIFGLKTITFWQALRLLILAAILFGGNRVIEIAEPDAGPAVESRAEPGPATG